jgi:RNA polymerase sigma-70 factor (ECF subfamily)
MQASAANSTVTSPDSLSMARAKRGDVRAFESLYKDHVGRVYGLCLRMTRDVQVAEDCTQEAFINAWRSLGSFQQRSSMGTWLHRIAVNVVLGRMRRAEPEETLADEMAEAASDEQPLPAAELEVNDLERILGRLPLGARNVAVLFGVYGYSHEETAQMLGIAVGTCKAQLHRARHLLKQHLAEESIR